MRKNLVVAIITPCILACILIILIIMDNRASKNKNQQDLGETEVVGVISPTKAPTSTPQPSLMPEETQEPTQAPTSAPTKTPTPIPEITSTITPSPVPTPTEEVTGDITGTPQSMDDMTGPSEPGQDAQEGSGEPGQGSTEGISEPEQGSTGDTTVPEDQTEANESVFLDTYNALYTQQGDDYTLVADSITGSFLIISQKDNSIRQTKYKYAPIYDDTPESFHGPVLGYKNQNFVFMAGNQLVASDGVNETELKTFENTLEPGFYNLNPVLQSDNRFMAGVEGTLVVIDSRDLTVEAYTQGYSPDFFVLTDEILCFSRKGRVPAGPYYNTLYTAQKENIKLHGMIGEIDEYVLDGNTVVIRSKDDLFHINLKSNTLIAPKQINREYTLYYPVYSPGIIQGLSDLRFVNYNASEKPVLSIQLPSSWEAECYYVSYEQIPYFYYIQDKDITNILLSPSGSFAVIDYTAFPLEESKYLVHSTVREKLYSGKTSFGEGEIFLLERTETVNNESLPFEIIYAWIPINGESRAYQMYITVPPGKSTADYLTIMKHLLKAE